jgi:hypothetical protein
MIIDCKQIEQDILDMVRVIPISRPLVAKTAGRNIGQSDADAIIGHMLNPKIQYLAYDTDHRLVLGPRAPKQPVGYQL